MIDITGYLCKMKYEGDRIILIHSIRFWERIVIWVKHPDYKFHRTWISNRPKMFDSDTKCENCGEAIDSKQSLSVVDHIIEQMQANPKTNSHE